MQARIARREQAGERVDDEDLNLLAGAGDTKVLQNQAPAVDGAARDERFAPEPRLPWSVLAGVTPPAERPGAPDEHEPAVLEDVRAYPYDAVAARAARLQIEPAAVAAALDRLAARKFVAAVEDGGHYLLPPGFYVSSGQYTWDFWDAMEREARALSEAGTPVDLVADATVEPR